MTKGKRTFGLFETEVKALKFLNEAEKHEATNQEIYEASESRGHPKYVIRSLSKRGLIEFSGSSRGCSSSRMTVDGYKKLEEYYRNQAQVGRLDI